MPKRMSEKLSAGWLVFSKHKLLQYGVFFILICLGILILSSNKVSFFGVTIEKGTKTIEKVLNLKDTTSLKTDSLFNISE